MDTHKVVDPQNVLAPIGFVQPKIGACAGAIVALVDDAVHHPRSALGLYMPDPIPKVRGLDGFGNVVVVDSAFAHVSDSQDRVLSSPLSTFESGGTLR
jgi:hypothetical protein